jgi:hypothetical protein
LAAALSSMVYWLVSARHMLEDVLIINASVFFYYLATLVWSVRRVATVADTGDAPCGGKYTAPGATVATELPKTDACNSASALASAYVILTAALMINTIVLAVVFFKYDYHHN